MKRLTITLALLASTHLATAQPVPAFRQVIPAAAHVEGLDGSFWSTDVVLYNPSNLPAVVTFELLVPSPNGMPGEARSAGLPDPLGPGETAQVSDVLASLFPGETSGALVITTREATAQPVPIVATSRTWTPGIDGGGSFGQGIPAIPWKNDGDLSHSERYLTGLEAGTSFRSNIGFVNLSETVAATLAIDIFDEGGVILETRWLNLAPRTWQQLNGLLDTIGLQGRGFSARVRLVSWQDMSPGAPGEPVPPPDYVTYGSIVDRTTNDPTIIEGPPRTEQWALARHRLIPVTANIDGAKDSSWQTDLTVHYPADTMPGFLQFQLIPSDNDTGTLPQLQASAIWPRNTKIFDDVLEDRYPEYPSGGMMVDVWNGGAAYEDPSTLTRIWTAAANGEGSYGQGIPGYPRVYRSDPIAIPGLENTAAMRTNLGVVNTSTNVREDFEVDIFDSGGINRGTVDLTLQPWSHTQINDVLGGLGLEGSGFTAVVRLVESENLFLNDSDPWDPIFFAYGSKIDNGTNDPTFVAGVPLVGESTDEGGDWYDFSTDAPWFRCPEEPWPEQATVISTFNGAHHYFGGENHRTIIEQAEFPTATDWNQVGLKIHLECPPTGPCDDWDRTGSLQLVLNPEEDQESWEYLELARYITPYKIEMCEYFDLTALAPVLTGTQTLVSWIDTWVGPGHSSGDGWAITYEFVFYPGQRRTSDEVVNIWGRRSIVVGSTDPDTSVDAQVDPVFVDIPDDVTRVEARLVTTGHAFLNTDNCAEFCPLRQDVYVNGERHSELPWRTDCEYNPFSPQPGTWRYDRNGWCPGAVSVGRIIDITDSVTTGQTAEIDFDIRTMDGEIYVNLDQADLAPHEWVSMQLFMYRD